jgi:hypothetical protein
MDSEARFAVDTITLCRNNGGADACGPLAADA